MGTRQIEFQAIGNRGKALGYCNEFGNGATKYRYQQKSILGDAQLTETAECLLDARVGEAHRVNKATWCVLTVNRFSVTWTRLKSDTLGCDDAHLRHRIDHPLNDGGGRRHNAGGYGEGP